MQLLISCLTELVKNSLPQSQTPSQKHIFLKKLLPERFLVLKMELLVKRKRKLLVHYWSKRNNYSLYSDSQSKEEIQISMPHILHEYANLWPFGSPSFFLVQNKNSSMFLAKQLFLLLPGLPYNVNGKCAPQNRDRKD